MTIAGKSHIGGKLNSVPQPNIDLNIARIPDPHPVRAGSLDLPPRLASMIPLCDPPQCAQP